MTLVILFLINVLNFYDRSTLGALAEPVRREFHLSDAALGGLTSAFTIIYALAGWPLGRLADIKSRKAILAWGVGAWSALTALGGLTSSYATLLATRIGVGIGEASCAPAATSWIGDAVPPERRTRALAWFMMAVPVGGMLSFSLTGPAAQAFGWRIALALAAAPALVLVPILLSLQEPKRTIGLRPVVAIRHVSSRRQPDAAQHTPADLFRLPIFWWISLSGAILNFALYSFFAFFPAFLTRFHHLSVGQAGLWAGIGTGVAGVAGALLAGALGDRVRRDFARTRMRRAAAASLIAAPLAFAAIMMPAGAVAQALTLIMIAYGLLQMYYGLVYAAMQDAVAPELRGTAMGAYFTVQYLGGAAWGPLLTGRLSDHFASAAETAGATAEAARAAGLHDAMYVIPALSLVLAAVLAAGAKQPAPLNE
jgi:MFS family permease